MKILEKCLKLRARVKNRVSTQETNCCSVLIRFLCIQISDRERCIELGEAVCTGQKKTKFSHSHKLEAG